MILGGRPFGQGRFLFGRGTCNGILSWPDDLDDRFQYRRINDTAEFFFHHFRCKLLLFVFGLLMLSRFQYTV